MAARNELTLASAAPIESITNGLMKGLNCPRISEKLSQSAQPEQTLERFIASICAATGLLAFTAYEHSSMKG
jgi:hypothetical protein